MLENEPELEGLADQIMLPVGVEPKLATVAWQVSEVVTATEVV